jgi:hypothetical protein
MHISMPLRRHPWLLGVIAAVGILALSLIGAPSKAYAITTVSSSVHGTDGKTYTVTNHMTVAAVKGGPREWLLVWAGAVDTPTVNPIAQDFIAVIDATKSSPTYGQVVNTVTVSPQEKNEPHHMQYIWHKGNNIYAGGILSDTTFVFDSSHLPQLRLRGINLPMDTPCGSAPDAYQVLPDGTAYASYLGGPNVAGPCTYTNGQVRVGNGYAGSPGEIVHIGTNGQTLAEIPAASAAGESPAVCHNTPVIVPATCANPHGIAVREDLHRMVTADYTEIKNNLVPGLALDPLWLRNTVRIFDITKENDPTLLSTSYMKVGPRPNTGDAFVENRMVMEAATTNQHQHKGAFASTMAGGAVYYTPDITKANPVWQEVFDDTAAYRTFDTTGQLGGSNDGGSWLQVSPDDKYLYHSVMGADFRQPRAENTGMVYVLDIQKLLASGENPKCSIKSLDEVYAGGKAPDCPAITGVVPITDDVSPGTGTGPHWGAEDNFARSANGTYAETQHVTRIVTADYFLSAIGLDGDHRVCMFNISAKGVPTLDTTFRDENSDAVCVSFNRQLWPQGAAGFATPHGVLFVVSNSVLK